MGKSPLGILPFTGPLNCEPIRKKNFSSSLLILANTSEPRWFRCCDIGVLTFTWLSGLKIPSPLAVRGWEGSYSAFLIVINEGVDQKRAYNRQSHGAWLGPGA